MKHRNFKTGYYQANNLKGVSFIGDILEDADISVILPIVFYDSLSTLDDEEIVVSFFDDSTFDLLGDIESEYGFNQPL